MTPQRTARETKSIILNNVVIFNGKEESAVRGSVRIDGNRIRTVSTEPIGSDRDRPAEEVKRMGYTVSGRAEAVDAYCTGRDVLSVDTLGGLKTACILGKAEEAPGLDVSGLDMQKLFIRLTNV